MRDNVVELAPPPTHLNDVTDSDLAALTPEEREWWRKLASFAIAQHGTLDDERRRSLSRVLALYRAFHALTIAGETELAHDVSSRASSLLRELTGIDPDA